MKEVDQQTPPTFLVIYGSYQDLFLGLYSGTQRLHTQAAYTVRASAQLLPLIDRLLAEHSYSLEDLSFIALDQGPGAFTSLRVVLTTVNGIAFARRIPLVGCDGLQALSQQMITQVQTATTPPPLIAALLNAYNNEVFYQLHARQQDGEYALVGAPGYADIEEVARLIATQNASGIWCAGNGATLHRELLIQRLGDNAHIDQVLPHADLDTLAQQAYARWQKQESVSYNLQPRYLKTQSFVKAQ